MTEVLFILSTMILIFAAGAIIGYSGAKYDSEVSRNRWLEAHNKELKDALDSDIEKI